jgi:hypothetical protein
MENNPQTISQFSNVPFVIEEGAPRPSENGKWQMENDQWKIILKRSSQFRMCHLSLKRGLLGFPKWQMANDQWKIILKRSSQFRMCHLSLKRGTSAFRKWKKSYLKQSRNFEYVVSRSSGRTRDSATVVMKFVSPDHLGSK